MRKPLVHHTGEARFHDTSSHSTPCADEDIPPLNTSVMGNTNLSARGSQKTWALSADKGHVSRETASDTSVIATGNVDRIVVGDPPPRVLQNLWVSLCPKDTWNSIALVPCDAEVDIVGVGHSVARAAALDRHCKVLLILLEHGIRKTSDLHSGRVNLRTNTEGQPQTPGAFYEALDLTAHQDRESLVYHQFLTLPPGTYKPEDRTHGHIILALGNLADRPKGRLITDSADFSYLFFSTQTSQHIMASRAAKLIGRDRLGGCISID